MLVKILDAQMVAVGATSAADFSEKLTAFITEAENNKAMATNVVTLETLQQSLTALEGKVLTEARVKEIAGSASKADMTAAITEWAGSAEGKKIIGAESSRIAMEALSAVGTQPAKPAPASNADPVAEAKGLIAQGKFEEAYALDKTLQAEFPTAKVYAAYAKAEVEGRVAINQPK